MNFTNKLIEQFIPKSKMHPPGIEPGASPWQGEILPLNQECLIEHEGNVIVYKQIQSI